MPPPTAAPSAAPSPAPFAPTTFVSTSPPAAANSTLGDLNNVTTTTAPSSSRSPVVPPTLPPTFNSNLNAAPVELATFVVPVTVQLDATTMSQVGTEEEVDPAVVAAVYRDELRKTLQVYLKEQLPYENLVFVQLNTTTTNNGRRQLQEQLSFAYSGQAVFAQPAPDRDDVLEEQTVALQDATAIRAAVQRNDILREATLTAGLTLGEITVVEDTNNDRDAQVPSPGGNGDDDNSDSKAGLIGGLVAAAVLAALVAAFLLHRRKNPPPPPLITTTHKQKQQSQQPFSPYGKEEETEQDHDHIVADLNSLEEEQQQKEQSSPSKPYVQLSPTGTLASTPGVVSASSGEDDEGDLKSSMDTAGAQIQEKAASSSRVVRQLETTGLMGTGSALLVTPDREPMDDEADDLRKVPQNSNHNKNGAVTTSILSIARASGRVVDDDDTIIDPNQLSHMYSPQIIPVSTTDIPKSKSEDSMDGYSLGSGFYGRTSAGPSALLEEPQARQQRSNRTGPKTNRPSWYIQAKKAAHAHNKKKKNGSHKKSGGRVENLPQQHQEQQDAAYTSDSESQFTYENIAGASAPTVDHKSLLAPSRSADDSADDDDVLLSLAAERSVPEPGHVYDTRPPYAAVVTPHRPVYSDSIDHSDSDSDDDDPLRAAALSPRLTKGYDTTANTTNDDDDDDDGSQPSDEMKDELSLAGFAADLEVLKREADRVLAAPVQLPQDGDVASAGPSI